MQCFKPERPAGGLKFSSFWIAWQRFVSDFELRISDLDFDDMLGLGQS